MKLVVSFTTSPKRIHQCQEMVNSIINQSRKPDLFLLNIPDTFSRTGESYGEYKLNLGVTINNCGQDWGPATKIVPTIEYLREKGYPEDTIIVYLDDDIQYPPNMLYLLEQTSPASVWTMTGFNCINFKIVGVREHGSSAAIAEGYGGVCVRMSMFKSDFTWYMNKYICKKECRLYDDIILSNYFAKKDIPIKIINERGVYSVLDLWENKGILDYGTESDALFMEPGRNIVRYRKVITELIKNRDRYINLIFIP